MGYVRLFEHLRVNIPKRRKEGRNEGEREKRKKGNIL